MALNPKNIEQGDEEEYENAAPTLGALMLVQFSTAENHNPLIYGADNEFFATHPERCTYLRPAFRNEWDVFTTEQDYENRPILWVLVSLLCPGFHEITPRWRGKSFWRDAETDQAIAEALLQMSLREGRKVSEWHSFISDQRWRKAIEKKLSKRSKRSVN